MGGIGGIRGAFWRLWAATIAIVVASVASAFLLGGCGGLSASSTCSDYLNADSSDQSAVLTQLAEQYHQPELVSPLGPPGVSPLCPILGC